MKCVDLSVAITEQTPVYPGDPAFKITPVASVAVDGCAMHQVSVGTTHAGTHIDAPSHMLEDGKNLNAYSVDQFVGRGCLVKVGAEGITLDLLKAADVQPGDIVLFWTGMSDSYNDPAYFETYPAIPEGVAQYLVDKKVKLVGIDACSVDHEEFVTHRLLLQNDVLIAENLTNLQALEGQNFTVCALPIKLEIDGAPARVIAQLEEN